MKDRPILFSAPMVRAILDGSKTQTRRIIKPILGTQAYWTPFGNGMFIANGLTYDIPIKARGWTLYSPYEVGMKLQVKETFARIHEELLAHLDPEPDNGDPFNNGWSTVFRADGEPAHWEHYGMNWKPSIFMPRKLSRITLEITSVRVERLQDISEKDAFAEGCEPAPKKPNDIFAYTEGYEKLWESINGKGSWAKNPWVWVLGFRRL